MKKTTIVTFFNHKGGVGKTTTALKTARTLAEQGYKVLMVDLDSQCNLTYKSLGQYPSDNIMTALDPVINSKPVRMAPAIAHHVSDNLYIMAGSFFLSDYERDLFNAYALAAGMRIAQNLLGSLCHLVNITAESIGADIVLIDTSPNTLIINEIALQISDGIMIPSHTDKIATEALESVKRFLDKIKSLPMHYLTNGEYKIVQGRMEVLGIVVTTESMRKEFKSEALKIWNYWAYNARLACDPEAMPCFFPSTAQGLAEPAYMTRLKILLKEELMNDFLHMEEE